MALDALSLLGLFSITIFIGYVGSLFFKKTGVSDIIWLMLLGLVLGPILGFVDRAVFIAVLPFLSALALILILFDSGLNMDFYQVLRGFGRSAIITTVGVAMSALAVAFLMKYMFGFGLLEGLTFGAIFGGTTTATVSSIVNRFKSVDQRTKTVLTLESVFTDPLTIILPLALFGMLAAGAVSGNLFIEPTKNILSSFSVAAVIGTFAGVAWLLITGRLKERKLGYMITLAAVFLLYVFVQGLSYSGAIAVLVFGLVVGNRHTFFKMLKFRHTHSGGDKMIKFMQNEVTFFIRSFFFVYLGLIASVNFDMIVYGVAIVAALAAVRVAVANISVIGEKLKVIDRRLMSVMIPKGLAVAVVSQIPLYLGLPHAELYSSLAFVIILGTNIYTAIASFVLIRISHGKPAK